MEKLLNKRESNFELLRIISMIFIILHHLVFNGGYQIDNIIDSNNFVLTLFMSAGKLGTVLFAMITGYYMINNKGINMKKLISLELQVLFYSIILFFLFVIFQNKAFTLNELTKIFFPNIFKSYWFFSGYFILYLCIPYLNKLMLGLERKDFEKLLLIGFIFLILLPSFVIYNKSITESVYLFYYYMVGSYIRLFLTNIKGRWRYLLVFIISYLVIILLTMYIRRLSLFNNILTEYIYTYSKISSIFVFICGVSLFLFFKGLKIGSVKIINLLASVSFGVYLFHEHTFMRDFLWRIIFSNDKLLGSGSILISGLLVAVIVYLVGGIFELGRKVIFKYFNNMIEKIKEIYF